MIRSPLCSDCRSTAVHAGTEPPRCYRCAGRYTSGNGGVYVDTSKHFYQRTNYPGLYTHASGTAYAVRVRRSDPETGLPSDVFYVYPFMANDEQSRKRAMLDAIQQTRAGRMHRRRREAVAALHRRILQGRIPTWEDNRKLLEERLIEYEEVSSGRVTSAVENHLRNLSAKIRGRVDRDTLRHLEEEVGWGRIADVLTSPGEKGKYLYLGHEFWADVFDPIRSNFTSLSHRAWTGGLLGEVRKVGNKTGLYKRMLHKTFGDRLDKRVTDALVDMRLFQTDHLLAATTDDPLNFVLMFSSANAIFGRATYQQAKEKWVGPEAKAGAVGFVDAARRHRRR